VIVRRVLAALAVVAAAASVTGCDKLFAPAKSPFRGIDVTGGDMGRELRLRDPSGAERTLGDFRGKVVVVSFGYTHCPDVCPMTLANLASARRKLGDDGKDVQVLFVTVDPQRDTPEVLAQYVPAFDPTFIGLTGSPDDVSRTSKSFHVYANARPAKPGEPYMVDHSAQMFAFDRQGRVRLVFAPDLAPDAIASDLRILLNG
jgi:protein SCO1